MWKFKHEIKGSLLDYTVTEEMYRGADKSLARHTSRCILFDGENISFDASLVIYIHSTNIPPIMVINRRLLHYYCKYSALGPVWTETRAQSGY